MQDNSKGVDLMKIALKASSVILATVGTAIIPKRRLAVNAHKPTGIFKIFCKKGATITIPKKPYTIDGIPAIISIRGFSIIL